MTIDILLQKEPIVLKTDVPPEAGAVVRFEGRVRADEQGRAIRRSAIFPRGTNVNFVQLTDSGKLIVRTYERGVEDETLACGTGVVASALILNSKHDAPSPVSVRVRGGDALVVSFERDAGGHRNVTLTGPADFVFEGEIGI